MTYLGESATTPDDCIPVTVSTADRDLLRDPGLLVAIRGVLAYPTGITFVLMIAVRGRDVTAAADYRWITGARPGYRAGVRGLVLEARAQDAAGRLEISCSGGGGGGFTEGGFGTRLQYTYWLALPANAEDVTITATWPDLTDRAGVAELPLPDLREAASRCLQI